MDREGGGKMDTRVTRIRHFITGWILSIYSHQSLRFPICAMGL